MAGASSLNARSLEALGAARLAELLLEHTQGNATARRALRLALAEVRGPQEMAQQVRKRLTMIGRSKRWLDAKALPPLLAELEGQRQAIVATIGEQAPGLAVELLWRFLDLANPLLDRVDDSDQKVVHLFHQLSADLGRLVGAAGVKPAALAELVAEALLENREGQYDHLVEHLAAALGPEGLRRLRQRLLAERPSAAEGRGPLLEDEAAEAEADGLLIEEDCTYLEPWRGDDELGDDDDAADVWAGEEPLGAPPADDQGHHPLYSGVVSRADDFEPDDDGLPAWRRSQVVREALLAIADGLAEPEAYLADYRDHRPDALRRPRIAARVAMRFVAAGQAEQALVHLDQAVLEEGLRSDGARVWIDARLAALEALGRGEEAQALRRRFALQRLSLPHLRTWLQRLPAFEDEEALQQALDAVMAHRHPWRALLFLHRWPDHRRAAQLIQRRPDCLNGNDENTLKALVQTLEPHNPLAASLCLREMLIAILDRGRNSDYNRGVRYLEHCLRLAPLVKHWGNLDDHNTWVVNLLWFFSHRHAFFNKLDFDPQFSEQALPD
ncbi:MAG: DUF6880 family protein [Cyanobium sp.]